MKVKVGLLGLVVVGAAIAVSACSGLGQTPSRAMKESYAVSTQWDQEEEIFQNILPQGEYDFWAIMNEIFFNDAENLKPETPLPIVKPTREEYAIEPYTGLRVTWMGHSTLYLEIDGTTVLIDPVWSQRSNMVQWFGPERAHEPVIALEDLTDIDIVVISHDHYDHLDMGTVEQLSQRDIHWVVPLGVESHLSYWDIPDDKITELDWWQSIDVKDVKVTATPSRHSSGRNIGGSNATLWAGWSFNGTKHSIFYSGDTSMHDEFTKIGQELGPFDLSIIEIGAYNKLWYDSHLGPEQALMAHREVGAKKMLPVHWCTFNLATHSWVEPAERVLAAAEITGDVLVMPKIGQMIEPTQTQVVEKWWDQNVPWQTAEEHPIMSSLVKYALELKEDKVKLADNQDAE